MSKCVICGKECTGECCSGACRAKKSRRTVKQAHAMAHGSKRGADIKTFEDLPPDVQQAIDYMSQFADNPSEAKAKRTAAAIHYQHLFPNSYENKGLMGVSGRVYDKNSIGFCSKQHEATPVQPMSPERV